MVPFAEPQTIHDCLVQHPPTTRSSKTRHMDVGSVPARCEGVGADGHGYLGRAHE